MLSEINIQGHGIIEFDPTSHGSVLDALESAGVQIDSMCRDGFCGACKANLVGGNVVYHKDPIINESGPEFLPCSCRPGSKTINISI